MRTLLKCAKNAAISEIYGNRILRIKMTCLKTGDADMTHYYR